MIRLGIVDFDTSHVVAFTQRLNHIDVSEDQWVDGAKVVVGCPGESVLSPERIPGYAKQMQEYGVPLVDKPEEMIGQVDAVLIESVDGNAHYGRAVPFLEAGLPVYVDKPFTCDLKEAVALAELAQSKNLPIFSTSSLRYGLEVVEIQEKTAETGAILGVEVCSPASLHPRNPGLFHYGIHGVETLYTLMGPGCESVWAVSNADVDVVTGCWRDGRVGTLRGIRKGQAGYAYTAYCEKAIVQSTINAGYIYRELLKQIVQMFETGKAPIDISETVELVAFIEAAIKSAANDGAKTALG
jgi:virulence factor